MAKKNEIISDTYNAKYLRKKNQRYIDLGLCVNCIKEKAVEGNRMCQKCRNSHNKKSKERTVKLKAMGYCKCGKINNLPRSQCEECYFRKKSVDCGLKSNQWVELRNMLERQNYICPYTGDKLVLGINASIDHIKPKSRFPELHGDLTNLEWVSWKINLIKRDQTKEEFIELSKTIVRRLANGNC